MRARYLLIAISLLATGTLPVPALSDTLVIPDISNQPANAPQDVPRPTRGLTMDQVRSEFGDPLQVFGPVGDPPITRWVYDKFTVHFESEYVIHSVVNKNH